MRAQTSGIIIRLAAAGAALLIAAGPGLAQAPASAPRPATPSYSPQTEPMVFRLATGDGPGGARTWVSATGQVQSDTAVKFRQFMAQTPVRGLTLVLDSSGGRVGAAMDLGRIVRAQGMETTVGRTVSANGRDLVRAQDVRCASACVLVLMGGARRKVSDQARVEVHMFSVALDSDGNKVNDTPSFRDIEQAQRTMARHAVYVAEMGVEARFLELMVQASFRGATKRLTMDEITGVKLAERAAANDNAPIAGFVLSQPSSPPQLLRSARLLETAERGVEHELVLECDTVRGFFWTTYRQKVTRSQTQNANVGVLTARLRTGGWDYLFRAPNSRPLMILKEGADLWMRRSVPYRVFDDAVSSGQLAVELVGPNMPRSADLFDTSLAAQLPVLKRRCEARPGLVSVGGNPRR